MLSVPVALAPSRHDTVSKESHAEYLVLNAFLILITPVSCFAFHHGTQILDVTRKLYHLTSTPLVNLQPSDSIG